MNEANFQTIQFAMLLIVYLIAFLCAIGVAGFGIAAVCHYRDRWNKQQDIAQAKMLHQAYKAQFGK